MQLRSLFVFSSPSRVHFDCCVYPTITILFVGCNKESEQLFFCKKTHRTRSALHFTACVFNNRCVAFFFTSLMKESMITVRLQYYINSARALLLAAEVTRVVVVVVFHLISRSHFSHPSFTNCKLQNTRMLTDTDLWRLRCSPLDLGITHNVK